MVKVLLFFLRSSVFFQGMPFVIMKKEERGKKFFNFLGYDNLH